MEKRRLIVIAALALVAIGAILYFLLAHRGRGDELTLSGNVDLRTVELPFADSERIAEVRVEEGMRVHKGDVLARLDTARLTPRVQQSEARLAAQNEALRRLRNGSRPEEIAQARAGLAGAQADAANARSQFERLQGIGSASEGRAVSQQEIDAARAALEATQARADNARKALDLAVAGPRAEDIAQARAQADAAQADLALLNQQLKDADLLAPVDAVVRSRLLEPGELATPQRAVFSLALSTPKWVRAYLSEADLGRVRTGMPATVTTDSAPQSPVKGTVSFISSTAEFTPKTVQTDELRTSLVYEIRVLVDDAEDRLRLGMPATVHIDLKSNRSKSDP
jgi:HlyD family secretion protein